MIPPITTIQDAFARAPEETKNFITSDLVNQAFYDIRTTHKLHVDHAGNLAIIIDAVVLGLNDFTELPALIAEGLPGVPPETVAEVSKTINDTIFVPFRAEVKKRTDAAHAAAEKEREAKAEAERSRIAALKAAELENTAVPEPRVPPSGGPVRVSAEPAASVTAQKMSAVVAPPVESHDVTEKKPYRGTDPYREAPE